jgi:hypothetical protein
MTPALAAVVEVVVEVEAAAGILMRLDTHVEE